MKPLSQSQQTALRLSLHASGVNDAAAVAELNKATLLRAAAGMSVTAGTRALLDIYLSRATATSGDETKAVLS